MKGLLIKDFKLLKNQGKFLFIIFIMANIFLFFESGSSGFIASYMTFVFSMFALNTLSYDSYDNGMPFLLSLPITRKTYVTEKYIFSLFLSISSWLVSILLRLTFLTIQTSLKENVILLYADPIYLILSILSLSIAIPIHLKYGQEKGHIIFFGILGAIFLTIFTAIRVGLNTHLLHNLINRMMHHTGRTIILLCIICISIFAISYILSLRIMKRKEF